MILYMKHEYGIWNEQKKIIFLYHLAHETWNSKGATCEVIMRHEIFYTGNNNMKNVKLKVKYATIDIWYDYNINMQHGNL